MKITYVVLICVTMLSCQFPLKEENNVILPSKPKNNIKIDLLNFPDTLNLIENTTVSYSLNVGGSTPIAVFIAIGKEAQYFGYAPNGAFVLFNTNDQIQTKGYLPFEFAVFSTSGTGSLADRSQRELLLFSVKRILYFDYSSTKAINFTN